MRKRRRGERVKRELERGKGIKCKKRLESSREGERIRGWESGDCKSHRERRENAKKRLKESQREKILHERPRKMQRERKRKSRREIERAQIEGGRVERVGVERESKDKLRGAEKGREKVRGWGVGERLRESQKEWREQDIMGVVKKE